eukprot:TRINITY_DN17986_c0_g1_i1.p1 TRINITY_DN17986_c0_g1~~TRINITY_DN17986_c0_g1_i1.p1  ORF type:complete len:172 (-),score=31.84 TRINITY_DN17986_c0_g1_i1:63-551(-)
MKYMVAIDNSPCSRAAFDTVIRLVNPAEDEVYVLGVAEEGTTFAAGAYADYQFIMEVNKKIIEHTRGFLKQHGRELTEKGIKHVCLLGKGIPRETICNEAGERKVDLLVLGCRKHNAVQRTIVGSNSVYALHHAPCSVFVVKTECPEEASGDSEEPKVTEEL